MLYILLSPQVPYFMCILKLFDFSTKSKVKQTAILLCGNYLRF